MAARLCGRASDAGMARPRLRGTAQREYLNELLMPTPRREIAIAIPVRRPRGRAGDPSIRGAGGPSAVAGQSVQARVAVLTELKRLTRLDEAGRVVSHDELLEEMSAGAE